MKHKSEQEITQYLRGKIKKIIQVSALFLNTSEINVIEYLIDDILIDELIKQKKITQKGNYSEIDNIIAWLDDEWFSYRLGIRMAVLFSFKLF